MGQASSSSSGVTAKPKLRGVSHQVAFFVSPIVWVALLQAAPSTGARVAVAVYAAALSGLFGVSALLHRRHWQPAARLWMRRADHSMIFVAIAGTYTPVAALALPPRMAVAVLVAVWGGAVAGITVRLRRRRPASKRVAAVPYVAMGWVALAVIPQLLDRLGVAGVALLVGGGALYTLGAVVFARQWPDPRPAIFGYHEVFHAFVVAGAAFHLAAVRFVVLPRA
jgi:hemolysin III